MRSWGLLLRVHKKEKKEKKMEMAGGAQYVYHLHPAHDGRGAYNMTGNLLSQVKPDRRRRRMGKHEEKSEHRFFSLLPWIVYPPIIFIRPGQKKKGLEEREWEKYIYRWPQHALFLIVDPPPKQIGSRGAPVRMLIPSGSLPVTAR